MGRKRLHDNCDACGDPHFAKGLCRRHYDEARKDARATEYRARYQSDPEFRAAENQRRVEGRRRRRQVE